MTSFRSAIAPVVLLAAGSALLGPAQGVAEELSPFDRPGGVPSAAIAPVEAYSDLGVLSLTGISTLGGQSMFNFVNGRTKRSFWVGLGQSTDGFSAISYDGSSDTVVVEHAGKRRAIRLSEARIVALPAGMGAGVVAATAVSPANLPSEPTPVVAPSMAGAPSGPVVRTESGGEIANPKSPNEIAQAEMEARMMVSDLLEISMRERARQKALREGKPVPGSEPAAPKR